MTVSKIGHEQASIIIRSSINTEPPEIKALVLYKLKDNPGLQDIQQLLITELLQLCNDQWLRHEELYKVAFVTAGIYAVSPTLLSGKVFAHIAKRLIAAEVATGGPYQNHHGYVDALTNQAVEFLMQILGSPLPKVKAYLSSIQHQTDIIAELASHSATLKAVLTLGTYTTPKKPIPKAYQAIIGQARQHFESLQEPLRSSANEILESLRQADKNHEMLLISHMFFACLKHQEISPAALDRIGLANLYMWIAYTILDDFLDGEGRPALLPVATMALQAMRDEYDHIVPANDSQRKILKDTFRSMDQVNAWEATNCRFTVTKDTITIGHIPRYKQRHLLAERASGHILGPLLITANVAHVTQQQRHAIKRGLTHYLIARQLHDDVHDWQEDIQRGQISYVVAHILKALAIQPGIYRIPPLLPRMRQYFWRHAIEAVGDTILRHIVTARQAFATSGLLCLDGDFLNLLTSIEISTQRSLQEHQQQLAFLQSYRTTD